MDASTTMHEMLEPDVAAAANISLKSWDYPLVEADFKKFLGKKGIWPWILLKDGDPAGCLVFKANTKEIKILELAVRPRYRTSNDSIRNLLLSQVYRQAIGLSIKQIKWIIPIFETEALAWLATRKFKAQGTLVNHFGVDRGDCDGILMTRNIKDDAGE